MKRKRRDAQRPTEGIPDRVVGGLKARQIQRREQRPAGFAPLPPLGLWKRDHPYTLTKGIAKAFPSALRVCVCSFVRLRERYELGAPPPRKGSVGVCSLDPIDTENRA